MALPLDHVAIAVPSIRAVLPIFELISGTASSPVEHVAAQQVDVAFIGSGEARIELIQPTALDSSLQRFLDKRGTALHHVAYRVSNIDEALEKLAAAGVRLIDERARLGAGGHRVAFLHPESTAGILVELVER